MSGQCRPAGFVTRAIALVVDAAIVTGAATLAELSATLVLGLFTIHVGMTRERGALAAIGWLVVVGCYFVAFWTLAGQTPGMRFMGLDVIAATGGRLTWSQSVRRFIGMVLCALPAGAGFLLVLIDHQRRGLHDRLASSLVVYEPPRRRAVPAKPAT